jgi:hypothetical protein
MSASDLANQALCSRPVFYTSFSSACSRCFGRVPAQLLIRPRQIGVRAWDSASQLRALPDFFFLLPPVRSCSPHRACRRFFSPSSPVSVRVARCHHQLTSQGDVLVLFSAPALVFHRFLCAAPTDLRFFFLHASRESGRSSLLHSDSRSRACVQFSVSYAVWISQLSRRDCLPLSMFCLS